MWQPTLRSDLLTLRPVVASDWPALLAAASDPLVWELHPERDRWRPEVFAKFFDGALASGGALVVQDAKTSEIIGTSRFTAHRPDTGSVEIGYTFLKRQYWGGLYNQDMKRLMLAHAFTLVRSVWFVVGEANLRSRRALEKIGATLTPASESPCEDVGTNVVYRLDAERPRV